MIESSIERKLVRDVTKLGGLCYKWVSPGNKGVPDRIVFLNGRVYFVELKRPGEKPRPNQRWQHRKLEGQGIYVIVISTIECVNQFLELVG